MTGPLWKKIYIYWHIHSLYTEFYFNIFIFFVKWRDWIWLPFFQIRDIIVVI